MIIWHSAHHSSIITNTQGGKMKTYLVTIVLILFCIQYGVTDSAENETLQMKGFYLGMEKSDVQKNYQQLMNDKVAKYISIEKGEYRDLIKLDNEFSSMGNKIEIEYDDTGKAKSITFQYKTVDILFEASEMEAEVLVEEIEEKYELPEMVFEDLGMVKIWKYVNEELKYKISVDDYKNVRLQRID